MAETTPRTYIIGIIIFTMIIISGIGMFSEYREVNEGKFNQGEFKVFNSTFNKFDSVEEEVGDLEQSTKDTKRSAIGIIGDLIEGAWNTLTLLFESFSFMDDAYTGLNTIFGIPASIVTLIGLIVTVIIAFTIFSLIFQGRT